MTLLVIAVEKRDRPEKKPDAFVILKDTDTDKNVKAWCGDQEAAIALKRDVPLPSGWELSEGDFGPRVQPPRPQGKGGGGGWRQSKDGFLAEQAGRQRWQEVEEERKDRRTSLMSAVDWASAKAVSDEDLQGIADFFYSWLRSSEPLPPMRSSLSGGGSEANVSAPGGAPGSEKDGGAGSGSASPSPGADTNVPPAKATYGEGVPASGQVEGGGTGSSPSTEQALAEICKHPKATMTTTKPDGTEFRKGWGMCGACGKVLPMSEAT